MKRWVNLPSHPKKIISLVPSQTELLFDLGLNQEIIGVTKFCIHPKDKLSGKTKVGGTKNFRFDIIDKLQPDLIIGNKEENYQDGIDKLAEKYPVWMSDISAIEEALVMINMIGTITNTQKKAIGLVNSIKIAFEELKTITTNKTVAYLIWQNPMITIGKDTFIHDMLMRSGFKNVFAHESRYPEISIDDLAESKPELIFLSSEPYPFQEKHKEVFQEKFPNSKIVLVDGEMFSWYGSRLLMSISYIFELWQSISNLEKQ